ncbi:MAG: cyclomaltodextrin glucanotransferase, partial [Gammaproteobacteria bacterium]|nr:cyclomaltodextrin glucanotransferase [Gammaproteobacteria bacterium]
FRAGADQHKGNRDYFGQDNVEQARRHPIRKALARIAAVRKESVALQRGLQLNLEFADDTAAFLRVFRKDGVRETALVLLNKGDTPASFDARTWFFPGEWREALTGETLAVTATNEPASVLVSAHGIGVYITDAPIEDPQLSARLLALQEKASR